MGMAHEPQGHFTNGPHAAQGTDAAQGQAHGPHPDQAQWRHVHPLSPVFNSVGIVMLVLVAILANARDSILNGDAGSLWLDLVKAASHTLGYVIAGVVVVILLFSAVGYLAWKMTVYALLPDGFHLRRGIIFKSHQHIPWERIQSVDVVQPLLGRLVGLGVLKFDSGAHNTRPLKLQYLTVAQCSQLRAEILAKVGAAREAEYLASFADGAAPGSPAASGSASTADAPMPRPFDADDGLNDREIFVQHTPNLVFVTLVSWSMIILLICLVVGVFLLVRVNLAAAGMWLLIAIAVIQVLGKRFVTEYGKHLYLSHNGLRSRGGMLSVITRTVTPGRIHTVVLHQSLLWRRKNLWSLSVGIVGDNTAEDDLSDILIHAGTQPDVLTATWAIIPDLGVDDVPGFLDTILQGSGPAPHMVSAPKASWIYNWFGWRRQAIALTRTAVVIRYGFLSRNACIILHRNYQGLSYTQGPVKRRLGLADLHINTAVTGARTVARCLTADDAQRLLWEENSRGAAVRAATDAETLAQWRVRVGIEAPAHAAAPAPTPAPAPAQAAVPAPTTFPGGLS